MHSDRRAVRHPADRHAAEKRGRHSHEKRAPYRATGIDLPTATGNRLANGSTRRPYLRWAADTILCGSEYVRCWWGSTIFRVLSRPSGIAPGRHRRRPLTPDLRLLCFDPLGCGTWPPALAGSSRATGGGYAIQSRNFFPGLPRKTVHDERSR